MSRDIYTLFLYGGRVPLTMGFLAALTSTAVGALLSLVACCFGGFVDLVTERVVDALLAVLGIVLMIVFGLRSCPGAQPRNAILVINILSWPP